MRPGYQAKPAGRRGAPRCGQRRRSRERERWPRERIERRQRERIDAIVRHAVARSPFYRERFDGLVGRDRSS